MTQRRNTALEILNSRISAHPGLAQLVEEERVHAQVAREIYGLRTQRGLTQGELAARVGTKQSVISRLEDADYQGHSLRMLRRIATALHAHVQVRLVEDDAGVA